MDVCMYALWMYMHVCMLILGLGKMFQCSNLHFFAVLNFSLRIFATTLALMFHMRACLCNLNIWLILWACSRKFEAVSVTFVKSSNSKFMQKQWQEKTSNHFKTLIQFWRQTIKVRATLVKTPANHQIFDPFC